MFVYFRRTKENVSPPLVAKFCSLETELDFEHSTNLCALHADFGRRQTKISCINKIYDESCVIAGQEENVMRGEGFFNLN